MKGVLLAGGSGTRLYPITRVVSKQLVPVFDKPMVYYPLSTLMLAGIRDILVITTAGDQASFRTLLRDGSQWGLRLSYAVQEKPEGIAQALIIAREFLAGDPCMLVLGDNLFFGHGLTELLAEAAGLRDGARIFAYRVDDPSAYGVVSLDSAGRPTRIVEKPIAPESPWAVTGLYAYDARAPELAAKLTPSARGELEISDLNRAYLEAGALSVTRLGRGFAWLDTGTHESLLEASTFVSAVEQRQGLKIACVEEIAFRMGFIDASALETLASELVGTRYGDYLAQVADEGTGA
jgi:glucose-1-phosphate thymidylyltransferase